MNISKSPLKVRFWRSRVKMHGQAIAMFTHSRVFIKTDTCKNNIHVEIIFSTQIRKKFHGMTVKNTSVKIDGQPEILKLKRGLQYKTQYQVPVYMHSLRQALSSR